MRLGDETLIARTLKRLQSVTDEAILISNAPNLYTELGVRVYEDLVSNTGVLGGVYTGLSYALNNAVLCVACDMPLLQPNLLTYLLSVLGEHDAVVPYTRDVNDGNPKLQTLCAVYSRRCAKSSAKCLMKENYAFMRCAIVSQSAWCLQTNGENLIQRDFRS